MISFLSYQAVSFSIILNQSIILRRILSYTHGGEIRRLHQGRTQGWKVDGTKVWVPTPARGRARGGCGRGSPPPPVGVRGITPEIFLKTQMLNPAFWWLLRSLVGSRGRVYPSKQHACQGLNQFQNFNFSAVVAPLVVRTKNQSNRNYETCKLHATRHLGP